MKEHEFLFKKGLGIGLRRSDKNTRNTPALVVASGMIPEEGTLRSIPEVDISEDIIALGETFPYPQLHKGQVHTVVFGAATIWEWQGSTLVEVLSGLTEGSLWSVADFYEYLVATNGAQIVKRDPATGAWSVLEDENVPVGRCVAAVNGQLIIGSPEVLL